MHVLVSGHNGYIGSILSPMLVEAGHDVTGLDTFFYEECTYGSDVTQPPAIRRDVRDVQLADLDGIEAVIDLAALSNDPLGDLSASVTYEINHRASVNLALLAREAGAARYLYSSSCSLYGAAGTEAPNPSMSGVLRRTTGYATWR